MCPLAWRKPFYLFLLASFLLIITTAVSLAQSIEKPAGIDVSDSSITICLENSIYHPDRVDFSGDLGSFTLSVPPLDACHTEQNLAAGMYTIIETLPEGYFGQYVYCREIAGSGLSQWQTTLVSATIDLAASSDIKCIFHSLPNPDEPNDTLVQAISTTYGGMVNATIGPHPDAGPAGDIDVYRFDGYAEDTLFVDCDTYDISFFTNNPFWLRLKDESGAILAQQSTGSPQIWLEHQLLATGAYFLEATVDCADTEESCTGIYGCYLGIIDPYEPNDTPGTAAPINFGEVLRGYIDNYDGDPLEPNDYDYYRFQGSAGDAIEIDVRRFNDEQILSCDLLDAAQSLLASVSGSGCHFEETLVADGDYYIEVYNQKSPPSVKTDKSMASSYWYGPWNGPYAISLMYQNEAPVANPDNYKGLAGEMLIVSAPGVLENDMDADGDPLTAVLSSDVQHGSLSLSSDGAFTYEPDPGYTGAESFEYYAFDGSDPSASVIVTITIDPSIVYLPAVLSK